LGFGSNQMRMNERMTYVSVTMLATPIISREMYCAASTPLQKIINLLIKPFSGGTPANAMPPSRKRTPAKG